MKLCQDENSCKYAVFFDHKKCDLYRKCSAVEFDAAANIIIAKDCPNKNFGCFYMDLELKKVTLGDI